MRIGIGSECRGRDGVVGPRQGSAGRCGDTAGLARIAGLVAHVMQSEVAYRARVLRVVRRDGAPHPEALR